VAITAEKASFIEELVRQGIASPGRLQRALKERFGSGVAIAELAPLIRGRGKGAPRRAKKKVTRAQAGNGQPARAPAETTSPWVSPASGAFVVKWASREGAQAANAESMAEAERAVEEAVRQGSPPGGVAVYRKRPFTLDVKATIAGALAPVEPYSPEAPAEPPRVEGATLESVYGAYGRAMFACQSLERLVATLLWGEGARDQELESAQARRARRKKLAKATFGQMVPELAKAFPGQSALLARLKKSLKTRIRLARSFFTEVVVLESLESEEGREAIRAECESTASEAKALWEEMTALGRDRLGGVEANDGKMWSKVDASLHDMEREASI